MDLSNVVFLESTPQAKRNKNIEKTPFAKRNNNNAKRNGKKKFDNDKKAKKKAPLKARKSKHTKPEKKKPAVELPKNWTKVPPKADEPNTKKCRGKNYHWCQHCNFWGLHKPGKGKFCQAVDPLAHLLNYFGGNNTTNNTTSAPPQQSWENVSCISMDVSL